MPGQRQRGSGRVGPQTGDDQFWFHLLPKEAVTSPTARPSQRDLLANPMVSIPFDLYLCWLAFVFRWIPTESGDLGALLEGQAVVGWKGAGTAKRIFRALGELVAAGPPVVELPGPHVIRTVGESKSEFDLRLSSPQEEVQATFRRLTSFAETMERGSHLLVCAYWVERPD